ncbi:MAG: helix-turn-helix transcriptional regulator [Anaerolineae bacterium]|nr:helix-turn-helix transcriptional regulator [Anaerolineae bacterium]
MEPLSQFSEKEKAVIDLLLQGKSNKQIALDLGVSSRTIEFHLSNIYAKLGVNSRSEAILMITKNSSLPSSNRQTVDDLRKSTVVIPPMADDNGKKPISPRRIPMQKKKLTLIGSGLLIGILIIFSIFSKNSGGSSKTPEATPTPETGAAVNPSPAPSQEQIVPVDDEYTFTQTVDSTVVKLFLNWFYIDSGRMHLDITVCDLPVPDDFKPVYIIDPRKIALYKADGSPIEIVQHTNFGGGGGGGGGEEQPSEEKVSCYYNQTFEYSLKETSSAIAQEESYILDIPVGGSVTDETGEIRSIPSTTFHLEVKPTYSRSLTFATQKTAVIENKTVTFKGLEVNPSSAAAIFCVFDPEGEQWFPSVNLLYKGNIITPFSAGLIDGSSGDTSQEMCYRLNYSYTFRLDATSDPKTELSILVAKLTRDQPERLSYQLIAHAQNQLAEEGIEFSYVIVSHGSNILITKKPEGLSEAEALKIVQDSLTEEAAPTDAIVFDLQ